MKNFLAKIWFPTLLIGLAAVQSFGIDASRALSIPGLRDSIILSRIDDTSSAEVAVVDSSSATPDTLAVADTAVQDTIAARDTIRIPDSLEFKDPFFFKYYIAVKDSTTRKQIRDSLMQIGDTLELMKLDSLYIKDSTEVAVAKFNAWYNSLTRKERKKYDYEQELPAKIAEMNRKMEVKDSLRAVKDSIISATPRILETFAVPDSMHYKRIITWKHDRKFHDVNIQKFDTTYNYHFYDYPFFKEDVNTTWLGVSGSPEQSFNYFKRENLDNAIFYTGLQRYSFTAENLLNYNTKTPYTELAYWGTLFSTQDKEESNIKVLTTQNITPALNITLGFQRFGGNGMLKREDTNNRNVVMATNYMGKRYLMHAGYIYNKVERSENGGIVDNFWIRDTTVDAREIEVNLRDASNSLKKNTLYLDQTYRIPFSFINKLRAKKDSTAVDTLSMDTDITSAFIGHSTEYSVYRKMYKDDIGTSDKYGREFYGDRFYINPTKSADSLRVMKFENKVFLRLQPWKSDGIVSKLDVGVGDKLCNYYSFQPADYIQGRNNVLLNSMYLYAGAKGQYKKYLNWNADGQYTFLGYELNDFGINADVAVNFYPFRKDKQSPLTLRGHFETNLKEPDYYEQHLYTNHFKWDNDFGKISTTKVEAFLDIPRWDLYASFGYGLLSNNIYYDNQGIVQQNTNPMSVMTASLKKNFTVWKFHLDHDVLFQLSSNQSVVPLPMLALNLRYYFQFDVVKKVMQMQIGANGRYTTKWYAPAYNPVLGVFHNQDIEQYGNCPYIDVFVNIQWKRACIFLKAVNLNMGWPNKSVDYFSAAGYIAPQRAFKFGIHWPFYIQPGRGNSSNSSGSKGGGGGLNLPGGLTAR
ncbi:MAG: putative porin [Bacteroidales bacterium]|nr:putative porin [Bacteroidales bacterium]